jgi:hypothetical protein
MQLSRFRRLALVRITIDEHLKNQLLASDGFLELCDESGKLIARVTAVPESLDDPWSYFPELTPAEVERRCNSDEPGLTTAEVKEYLRNQGKS